MQKEKEKFLTMVENEQVYKDELQADIEAKEEELTLLDDSYKQALTSDDDMKKEVIEEVRADIVAEQNKRNEEIKAKENDPFYQKTTKV